MDVMAFMQDPSTGFAVGGERQNKRAVGTHGSFVNAGVDGLLS
jgi:hypothetical protein